MQAEDLYLLTLLGDPQIAPDGRRVVYTQQRVDAQSEKKFTNLWMVDAQEGAPHPFTAGEQNDRLPRWSPDGRTLAFLSNRGDEKQSQIYLIPTDGGEARQLTNLQGEFSSYAWSPQGDRLVVQFRQKDQETLAREADEQKKKLGVVARRITRLDYKSDGTGYLPQERWHLWLVDVQSGEAMQLTTGELWDERTPAWSPDGEQILFISNRAPQPDLALNHDELWTVPVRGGPVQPIPTFGGRKSTARFSPDGRWIALTGSEGTEQFWRNVDLWLISVDGSVPPRNLTGSTEITVGVITMSDTAQSSADAEPVWREDGEAIYVTASQHGRSWLWEVPRAGGPPIAHLTGDGAVGEFSLAPTGRLAYSWSTPTDPGQIWVGEQPGQPGRPVTQANRELLSQRSLCTPQEQWFTGPGGEPLQGWILTPPDFDPTQRYPAILTIHGGPMLQYGQSFFHEFQLLAGRGYVIFYTNPRGSKGYGNAFVSATQGDFGGQAYADLMAWTDLVAALPYVDEDRLGVTGGSYGGYMTNWIVGHTNRFRAAVTQRSLSNLTSFNGSSDVWSFEKLFAPKPGWAALDEYWRQSPLAYVGHVTTPTLVMHSERDLRVAQEQGEQFFKALRLRGVETELILFPEESHGLSRGGRTDRRIARLGYICDWFDRFLHPSM